MKLKQKQLTRADLPPWAKSIIIHTNGIDGYPPGIAGRYEIEDYLTAAKSLKKKCGGGEWDVRVYASSLAVTDPKHPKESHPYQNSYSTLHSTPGNKVKLVEQWSYMDGYE
jgi:hypothetical protein